MKVSISEAVQLNLILVFAVVNAEIAHRIMVNVVFYNNSKLISNCPAALHWNEQVGQQTY